MNKNVRIALLFLGLLSVWFLSGFVSDTQEKEQTSKKKAVSQSVQALNLKGQMYSPQLILKANTEAFRELKLISQVSGKIREIYVTEGSIIGSGEVVCGCRCGVYTIIVGSVVCVVLVVHFWSIP